jgi:hypothetical protein
MFIERIDVRQVLQRNLFQNNRDAPRPRLGHPFPLQVRGVLGLVVAGRLSIVSCHDRGPALSQPQASRSMLPHITIES